MSSYFSVTESASNYDSLETMSTSTLLQNMNAEDTKVPLAVNARIPELTLLVEAIYERMVGGGRLFYIGAGTSGRLGVVDASEGPPTYGIDQGLVVGLIAGGDGAIRIAVENAEDSFTGAWEDLSAYNITSQDSVIGIAASGRTPYVIGGLRKAHQYGCVTGAITCNAGSPVCVEIHSPSTSTSTNTENVDVSLPYVSDEYSGKHYPIAINVGPEFVTGSTRMKAGTAQKLALNMISTSLMIRLGHVRGNKMVDMKLSNVKLIDRGVRMVKTELIQYLSNQGIDVNDFEAKYSNETIEKILLEKDSVRAAADHIMKEFQSAEV